MTALAASSGVVLACAQDDLTLHILRCRDGCLAPHARMPLLPGPAGMAAGAATTRAGSADAVAISPDGDLAAVVVSSSSSSPGTPQWAASGGGGGMVRLVDVQQCKVLREMAPGRRRPCGMPARLQAAVVACARRGGREVGTRVTGCGRRLAGALGGPSVHTATMTPLQQQLGPHPALPP